MLSIVLLKDGGSVRNVELRALHTAQHMTDLVTLFHDTHTRETGVDDSKQHKRDW